MKQKINLRLIGMSVVVAIVSVLSVTFVFYGLFQRQVRNDLRVNAEVLKATGIFDGTQAQEGVNDYMYEVLEEGFRDTDSYRVTWIDADGTVLYDNETDVSALENHSGRPEFIDAMEYGEGEDFRRSDTMSKNTYYYAILLNDGSVLRLSAEVSNVFGMFVTALPLIILIVAVIIVAAVIIGRLLTRQFLASIDKMARNIEDAAITPVYKELVPFVDMIREQHEDVLSAAKIRQDFTANVSHELKTPLTAISGYAELIENHMVDSEEEARFAEQIRQNADRLLSLINDIIELSELDSGTEERFVFEQLDLYEVAQNCVDLLRVSADSKNVRISLNGEPCPMRGNRRMIVELIDNLCQNAIHYNHENGQVNVSVIWDERPTLTVADDGIGIPKDMQERIFERFFRVDKSRSKETGGTGLGLAIVKHIVELHDAEIVLTSEVGEGTIIKVIF